MAEQNSTQYEEIENIISFEVLSQRSNYFFGLDYLNDFIHFMVYACLKQNLDKKNNTITIYDFSKKETDSILIDGRSNDSWYYYALQQYKKVVNNKTTYDKLRTDVNAELREQYQLRACDKDTFEFILRLNNQHNNTAIRNIYRRYTSGKFESIKYSEMEQLYYIFRNYINQIKDEVLKNIETYKLETDMRFGMIQYALYNIAQFSLKCSKTALPEKVQMLTEISVQIMQQIPLAFNTQHIQHYFDLAYKLVDSNEMSIVEFQKEVSDCICKDALYYRKLLSIILCRIPETVDVETINLGLNEYSIFGLKAVNIYNYVEDQDFSKKHYKSLIKVLQNTYVQNPIEKK